METLLVLNYQHLSSIYRALRIIKRPKVSPIVQSHYTCLTRQVRQWMLDSPRMFPQRFLRIFRIEMRSAGDENLALLNYAHPIWPSRDTLTARRLLQGVRAQWIFQSVQSSTCYNEFFVSPCSSDCSLCPSFSPPFTSPARSASWFRRPDLMFRESQRLTVVQHTFDEPLAFPDASPHPSQSRV